MVSVNADDTDFVKAGQTLVTLDRADAEVALEQAQAALAQTVREVRTLYVTNDLSNSLTPINPRTGRPAGRPTA